jgi:dolichol-phosphate mannosyltransferase
MKVVIVMPTYNEGGNLERLLPMLASEFEQIPHECHLLIVDGNSSDNTQEVVENFALENPFVHLLVETEKEGLGSAYIKGFKRAIGVMQADIVMEMDGDLQHRPEDVKRFIEAIDKGADHVIGSRYTKGGSIPREWALYRKFLSFGGSLFSRMVLGLWGIKDITTGFKATRVKGVLDQLDLDTVMSSGFAYKIDLLFRMHKLGANIQEIPIDFDMRGKGDSKMEQNNAMDSLKVVLAIRMKESKHFLRFLVVGTSGAAVDFTFANLLRFSGISSNAAAALAAIIAMLFNYTLNNVWTFGDRKILGLMDTLKKLIPFLALTTIPILFRFWFVGFVTTTFADTWFLYNSSIAFSIGVGLIWNYTVYNRVIWRLEKKPKEVKK